MGRFVQGALCALLGIAFAMSGQAYGAKLAVPSAKVQATARELIREVYGEEVAAATTAESKSKVAKNLLDSALSLEGDPGGLYVLLRTSGNLAVSAGDVRGAFRAFDAMEQHFVVDGMSLRAETFLRVAKKVRSDKQRKALAETAMDLIDQIVAAEQYENVGAIVDAGLDNARRVRDKDLIASLKEIKKENATLVQEYAKVKVALVTLKSEPGDAAANTIVGRFRCFVQGKWDEGITHLALGEDETLKKLAIQELGGGESASDKSSLADGWWELANAKDGLFPGSARERAAFWYDQALAGSSGLAAKRIEKRLQELAEAERKSPGRIGRSKKKPSTLIAVVCGGTRTVKIIEFKTGDVKREVGSKGGFGPNGLAVSPNGKRLAVSSYQSLGIWDVASGKKLASMDVPSGTSSIYTVAFNRDGTQVASAGSGSVVSVWDSKSGKQIQTFTGKGRSTHSVAFSADGQKLIEASGRDLPIWDIKTGNISGHLSHRSTIRSVAVSGSGRLIVTGGYNDTVNFFSARTGQPVASLPGHRGTVGCLAISPDGDRVASGGVDGTVKVWDAKRHRGLLDLRGHAGSVLSVAFCPSGAYIVSAGADGKAIVWDAKNGNRIATIQADSMAAYGAVFVGSP